MSVLTQAHFHDEAAAYAKLEGLFWPDGPVCPHCGVIGGAYELKGKTTRIGLKKCAACRKTFTVKVGTVFEQSHVKLHLWFQAAHLMASSKKGISSNQLHRTLGVTLKTAWFMSHRLREAMRVLKMDAFGGEGKIVEADETYIGGKEKNKHRNKRAKVMGGTFGKEAAFALVERGGMVRSHHVPDVTVKTLRHVLVSQLKADTSLMTDSAAQYHFTHRDFPQHQTVNHRIGEYVRGNTHTNTIEGYFSILKRGIMGTYHHVSPQHLKRYLCEFDFRYNERQALGIDDGERTTRLLKGITGKRLTYDGSDSRHD